MSKRLPLRLMLAAATAAGLAFGAAETAVALPDAKVDQQIRPNFGGLINPPLRPHYRPERWKPSRYRWGRRPYRPGYQPRRPGYDDGYYDDYPRDQMVGVVDCGDPQAGPTPISDALQGIADNGILYIRGGAACHETIIVQYPVVIAGEGSSIFSGADVAPATIMPAAGNACIRIAAGVKGVELRDLNFKTEQGGRMPCIEAWDAEVALVRTNVEYWGDASALYASGGRVIMRDSVIDARSWDPAVLIEGAVIDIARSKIAGEAGGLDLTPGNGESRLDQVGIIARGGETPGDVGLLLRGLRSGTGTMSLRNVVVCGWTTGLHLERGAQVDMSRSRICNSQRGVISAGASLNVRESAIGAREIGAYIASGRASFTHNRFYGGGRPAYAEPGAVLEMNDNWVYWDRDCWRERFDAGLYCVSSRTLPGSLRDENSWSSGYRRGWEGDGYDRGFQRDGSPIALPPEAPPKKKRGWGSRREPAY
ncbi:MAG: hypothetical protein GC145_12130 [Caulobacter sp.]|nr:hypothetical protein [Caulobacter sp.]